MRVAKVRPESILMDKAVVFTKGFIKNISFIRKIAVAAKTLPMQFFSKLPL